MLPPLYVGIFPKLRQNNSITSFGWLQREFYKTAALLLAGQLHAQIFLEELTALIGKTASENRTREFKLAADDIVKQRIGCCLLYGSKYLI